MHNIVRLFLAVLLLAGFGVGTAHAAQSDCAAQQSALAQVRQQIAAHNAKPNRFIVPRQAAAAAAYDAEAAALRTAQTTAITNLQACRAKVQQRDLALKELADARPGSLSPPKPKAETLKRIDDARAKLPQNYVSPIRGPDAKGNWRVDKGTPPRALYDELRKVSPPTNLRPNVTFQGKPRPAVGDRNPAGHPNSRITANKNGDPLVSPDHIIPLTEIIHMRGFLQLNARNMYDVVNANLNFQWMASATNIAKNSRSAAEVLKFDPAWRAAQKALEDRTRKRLQDIIDQLLASQ